MSVFYLITRPRRSSTSPNLNERLWKNKTHCSKYKTIAVTFGRTSGPVHGFNLRGFLLGADGAFRVYGRVGVKHPLGQVNEGMVSVADGQALGLEEDAGLAIVRDAQRAVRTHQRLKELPLAERHPRMVPVKRLLNTQENVKGPVTHKPAAALHSLNVL